MTRLIAALICTGSLLLNMNVACAQNFPHKPIRMITTEPGGGTDLTARLIANGLSRLVGQQVIVDNRAAIVSMEVTAKASPDGYTLLVSGNSLWLLPFMRKSVGWQPLRDFTPVTLAVSSPNMITVHPTVSAKNTAELIALAKARPGELNYGSSMGGSTHLSAELFKSMTHVNLVQIPYRGNGPAMNALLAGQIQLMFPTFGAGMPHVHAGRLRVLGVTSLQPSALLPGVPTVAATVPGYESTVLYAVTAPSHTPRSVVKRLQDDIVQVLKTPEVKDQFFKAGLEVIASSSEQFAVLMKADMNKMGELIKAVGIKEE